MTPLTDGEALGVGIVVVSHSRALATAAVALAAEMLHGREPRIAVAAGLDDTTFGTDAVQIKTAIEQVDSEAGVVVLMDLGSAVLSAELALDLLDSADVRDRVLLCPAPLVEGLIVAAVAAGGGASRAEVAAEAGAALLGKSAHLSTEQPPDAAATGEGPSIVGSFTVENAHGLHARPAARLVAEMRGLDATVTVRNLTTGSDPVPATSLSRVATLGALQGHVVEVAAAGRQAKAAVDHLLALAHRRFDEAPVGGAAAPAPSVAGAPIGAVPGIGIGPVRRVTAEPVVVDAVPSGPPAEEWRRLVEAVADVRRDVERLRAGTAQSVGADESGIFDAHLMLLDDAELLRAAKAGIDDGQSAAGAWAASTAVVEREWAALPDSYLRARAADVRAVGGQVLRVLSGEGAPRPAADGVLVAQDLSPAAAATLDPDRVRAVVLAGGSATSHAAILVRSLGIPTLVAAGQATLDIPEGTLVVVDGTAGSLIIDPGDAVLAEYERQAAALTARRERDAADASRPAMTADGVLIEVAANLGSLGDARTAVGAGADGAGLIRTEFLFLDRDHAPSVEEQEREYRAMAEVFEGRPITIRTMDVGGDKPLRYLRQHTEANPFLGQRGLRLSLARPELLADQLLAICRVARSAPVNVMFPMVTTVEELVAARRMLEQAAGAEGVPRSLRVGIMVEVPAAALRIDTFLPHVDFVSIGTNDLTQYTLAVERGNPSVAALADPLDPAVLQLIAAVGRRAAGRATVAVCGEMAADEVAVPVLLGLGVTELSVAPCSVPAVKSAVRRLDVAVCTELAARCLSAGSPADVRKLVSEAAQASMTIGLRR
jgi:phosphoenolpyruvate-protein phosphotransferase/dihydroxyacetone kinase phosphotransfer subunit